MTSKSQHPEAKCGFLELAIFVGALVAGTGCSLFSKVLLSMKAVGRDGEVESFRNPLFQTWGMFLGMCASLPLHLLNEASKRRKGGYAAIGDDTPGQQQPRRQEVPRSTYYLLAIPSVFDLAATALAMFGLTYITVSVYQMLRGGAVVFVAILKHFVIGDKLAPFMWVGVSLNVVSIVMVGLTASSSSSSEDDESKAAGSNNPLMGVFLILCGAVVQSLQYAFEEKVMSADVGAPPLLVIAMEGLWGLLVCMAILYPLCTFLGLEDPRDTWAMLRSSKDIQIVFLFYFVSVFSYNMLGIIVTFMLNSVWHAILDNFRPITVWATDLLIFYAFSHGTFGEPWQYPGSYVQLAALAVLLYGTAVYNGSTRLPGFTYPDDDDDDFVFPPRGARTSFRESPLVIRASPLVASNALGRSPLIHGLGPGRDKKAKSPRLPTLDERSGKSKNIQMKGRSSSFEGV